METGGNHPVQRSAGDGQVRQEVYCGVRPAFGSPKRTLNWSLLADGWIQTTVGAVVAPAGCCAGSCCLR